MEKLKTIHLFIKSRLEEWFKKQILSDRKCFTSYLPHIEIGNLLIALSTTGMMALGFIPVSLPVLILLSIILFVIGVVGRYLDGIHDDVERLIIYEKSLTARDICDSSSSDMHSSVGTKHPEQ